MPPATGGATTASTHRSLPCGQPGGTEPPHKAATRKGARGKPSFMDL
jgi:hypothetical protein